MTNDEAINALKWQVEYAKEICESYIDCVNVEALDLAVKALEDRPQGEWIPNDKISPWGNPGRSCSLCGKIVEFSENFCPKCGADMRGKKND